MKASTQQKILIIGSTCVDVIINLDHLPAPQEDLHPTGHSLSLGGCAYNVASTVRLFGAAYTFVTPVGTGFYGEFVAKQLLKNGLTSPIPVPEMENGCCYCLVDKNGERTFLSCHGAEYTFQKKWMAPLEGTDYPLVYVCGLEIEEPTGGSLISYLEAHRERTLFYAPGPRGIQVEEEKTRRLFDLHPVLHVNEREAMELSGAASVREAAEILRRKTENTVIITLGELGTYCLEASGDEYEIPAIPTRITDTIGAGDSHIGTILACQSLGLSLKESIKNANHVASSVIGVKGSTLPEKRFKELSLPHPVS